MTGFERVRWRKSGRTLLSKKISNYIAAVFIVAIILPWIGFASLNSRNRVEQIELARSDVQLLATAFAQYIATAARPQYSSDVGAQPSITIPDWLASSAKLKHIQLYVRRASAPVPAAAGRQIAVGADARGGERSVAAQARVPGTAMIAVAALDETKLGSWRDNTWIVAFALVFRTILAIALGIFFVYQLRWREAAQAELIRTRKIAESAARAKSEFLAKMSHELRTPLNAIIGFSDAISAGIVGPLSARYREYAGIICNSGGHLLRLVDDLLDISKLESGRFALQEQPIDIYAVLRLAIQQWEPRAAEAKLRLMANIPTALPLMHGDGETLQRIIGNLLSNAVRFTPEGGRIQLSARETADGLRISIEDTGIGMAPDQIPIALQAFRQIASKFRKDLAGAGLGLPIARHLVELHGGTIWIESCIDMGTTVTIHFPADRLIRKTWPQTAADTPVCRVTPDSARAAAPHGAL
jgi:signal transduction histidine kinase